MRRQPNVRLFLWLLGILLGGALTVHVVHGFQVQRKAGALLRRARVDLAAGDVNQALTYFSHYLAYEPTDTDALAEYGLTLQKYGNTPAMRIQAMLVLEDVLRREPDRAEVRFHLVQCLIALGNDRLAEALDNLQLLLPVWPNRAEVEHMIGWCHEAREEYTAAADWFRKAVADDPKRIPTYALLAEVLHDRLDQRDDAAKVMDALVAANERTANAYLVRARFRKQTGALSEGEKDIQQALRLAPRDEGVLLAAAHWAEARGDLAAACKIAHEAELAQPAAASEAVYQTLAALELRRGRRAEAIACLRRGIDALSQAPELLVTLADLLLEDGNRAEALQIAERLAKENAPTFLYDYLRGRLAAEEQHWTEATDFLEKAAEEAPPASLWSSRAHALLGNCYKQSGDVDRELTAYERAVALAPDWSAGRLGLGAALLAVGRCDEALTEFRIVQQAPAPPDTLWPWLARALIQRNLRLRPQERDWAAAHDAIGKFARVCPDSVELPPLEAQVLAASEKYAAAQALLEKARDGKPAEPAFWTALAALAEQQKQWDQALSILDEAARRVGERIELRLQRVALLSARGGPQARPALKNIGANLDAFTRAEQLRLLRALAEAWYRLDDKAAAGTIWRDIARREPQDILSRLALFELALEEDRTTDARRLAGAIHALDGDNGSLTAYTQAALLLHEAQHGGSGNLQEADRLLAEVGRRRSAWTRVPLLRARIAELERDSDRAVDSYQLALNLGANEPAFVQKLARLLAGRRRYFDADQVLRRAEERAPLGKDTARLAAEIALAMRDLPRALRLAAAAASADSRDYRDLLWLARVFYLAGQHARAEQLLRRAVQVAGHAPDTWVALARHLARTNQRSAADQVLADMARRLPPDRYPLTLARCEEALGHLQRAEKQFARVVQEEPGNFAALYHAAEFQRRADQPKKAEPFLRRLLDPALGAPAEMTGWARRALAVDLAQSHHASAPDEAGRLLADNTRLLGPSVADDRAYAVLLGSVAKTRPKALALFEATLPRRPLSPDEQFALAQLYDAAREPAKARDWLQDLLASHPDTPQYLAYFVRSLIERDQTVDALAPLRRLEELEPGSARVRDLKTGLGRS